MGFPVAESLLLMGHGSRDPAGAREFFDLVNAVRNRLPERRVGAGVLEFPGPDAPSIADAFAAAVAAGDRAVRAVPVLLSLAGHAKHDMPEQVRQARARQPELAVALAHGLGTDPLLFECVEDRIAEATAGSEETGPQETAVLLVARGTSDPDANADMFRTGRLLWERNAFRWVEVGFVSLAQPFVPEAIARCAALGARRIVVVPYFINTGLLVQRICRQAQGAAPALPECEIVTARHIGVHPKLVDLVVRRATEASCCDLGSGGDRAPCSLLGRVGGCGR